ncbi:zinc finger protein 260 isoform X4 [Strongylocentrotus purpuratus]|nr:zinc finger protein 260 isoform X4 [Strongylocentrotus purpuratus]
MFPNLFVEEFDGNCNFFHIKLKNERNVGLKQEADVRTLNSVQPADLRAAETVQSFPEIKQEMERGTLDHHQTTYRSVAESVHLVPEDMIKQVAERGASNPLRTTDRSAAESAHLVPEDMIKQVAERGASNPLRTMDRSAAEGVQSVPEDNVKQEVQSRTLSSLHFTDMCIETALGHTNRQEMESKTSNSLRHTEQSVDESAPSVPEHIMQKAESWTLHTLPTPNRSSTETIQFVEGVLIKQEVDSNAVHYLSPMNEFIPSVIKILIKKEAEAFPTTCGSGEEIDQLALKTNIKQELTGESEEEGVPSSLEGKINHEVGSTTHDPVSSTDGDKESEQPTSEGDIVDNGQETVDRGMSINSGGGIVDNGQETVESGMSINSGGKSHLCSHCGKVSSKTHRSDIHLRIHSGEKLHQCPCCSKRSCQAIHPLLHLRSHAGEKPYDCCYCDIVETVERGMSINSGGTSHLCSHCGKVFSTKDQLEIHLRIHLGEKLHQCPCCG